MIEKKSMRVVVALVLAEFAQASAYAQTLWRSAIVADRKRGNAMSNKPAARRCSVLPGLFCFALALLAKDALSSDFQLKGLKLGMDEATACGSADVIDLQKTLDASSVAGISYPAATCKVQADTVAGAIPTGPLLLAFWQGRLVRVIARFQHVDIYQYLSINAAIVDAYGKASSFKQGPRPLTTDGWHSGTQRIELESAASIDTPGDVSIYLTDTIGWSAYQRVANRVKMQLDAQKSKHRSNDLVN